jgi:hypothetical protein
VAEALSATGASLDQPLGEAKQYQHRLPSLAPSEVIAPVSIRIGSRNGELHRHVSFIAIALCLAADAPGLKAGASEGRLHD